MFINIYSTPQDFYPHEWWFDFVVFYEIKNPFRT